MPQEVSPFKEQLQSKKEEQTGIFPFPLWQVTHNEKAITLVQTGIGKVHAAAAAQYVITQHSPDAIFSCGTAGGLDARCQIGDLVISTTTVQHDYGFVVPDTFIHYGIQVHRTHAKKEYFKEFPADTDLLNQVEGNGKHWNETAQVFFGPILTGDQVIFSTEKRHALTEQFGALAVDMESAAIAQICTFNEIPFLSIRGISDHADETFSFDLSKIDPNDLKSYSSASFKKKISVLAQAIIYFSQHPSAFVFSLQARQNIKIAAQNSATFTLRILQGL